jgi:hypothetical protein
MKVGWRDIECSHVGVRNFDTFLVVVLIQATLDGEPRRGRGVGDQLNDHFVSHQRFAPPVLRNECKQAMLDTIPLCALPRCTDVVGANPTRQLSLQPEAPGADQEATNGLKHFGKRSLWGSAGHTGRSTSEHRRGLERINVRADPPVERAGRRRQASERDTPLTVSPG